uniref:Uncharacterized protein n=1 Tax=Anopheles farauti TaxID=69004 RepID=A0A182QZ80_9DIPT
MKIMTCLNWSRYYNRATTGDRNLFLQLKHMLREHGLYYLIRLRVRIMAKDLCVTLLLLLIFLYPLIFITPDTNGIGTPWIRMVLYVSVLPVRDPPLPFGGAGNIKLLAK